MIIYTGVTVTTGVPCGERVVTTVPQYSIAPQYYYDQGHNTTYQVSEWICDVLFQSLPQIIFIMFIVQVINKTWIIK